MKIRSLAFLCMLVLLSQLFLVNGNQKKERKQAKENKEKTQDAGKQKDTNKGERKQAGVDQNEKRQKPKGGSGVLQGKFSSKDKSACTWAATAEDTITLKVECTKGDASFWCVFTGNPSSCTADSKPYWNQIVRALRKQKSLCQSPKDVLKSKVCKKGPQDSHLRLTSSSLVETGDMKKAEAAAQEKAKPENSEPTEKDLAKDDTDCPGGGDPVDQRKAAEEYCGKKWGSFCTFFFSMVQDKKC
ncbi:fibroblast growth factor-binding protein 1-like [Rhinatrema bivittatum]|uniref:fibroblast growth factor-binding protein 1-like n=1 Tax=Rhinatrema bivittatum TaxID=194408 RepID=UPI00112CF48D|nr:fibroblast growth factor-binding protein 1-like [Rhinatrema bivittatum]XP_029463357.1 fibroblast growth factor-binding protein 1-like [Rhinatrema bivittatum]